MFTRATAHNGSDSKSHHSSIFGNNESTAAFVQPKLNIGTPGDKYEVEADKAADQIVAKGKENTSSFIAPTPAIQKQSEEDVQKQESKEEIQQKPVVEPIVPGVQLKENPILQKMNEEEVQSKEEEEVQAQEEEIQQKVEEPVQLKEEEEEVQTKEEEEVQTKEVEEEVQQKSEEEVQTQPEKEPIQQKEVETQPEPITEPTADIKPILQKQVEDEVQMQEEEEVQEKEEEDVVQKQSTAAGDDGSNIESQLSDSKGGGSPLDSGTRNEMESGFGADFSGVRVHNDSNAIQMNQDLGSQAFTNGNDIYFNEGKYNPDSDSGKHLLAHELTHTVQQGASPSNTVQQSKIIQKEPAQEPAKPGAPTTVINLTQGLKLSQDWLDYIEANSKEKSYDVSVKIGSEFLGTISLKKLSKPKEGEDQKFELASKTKRYLDVQGMDFLNPLKDAQIFPILVLNNFGDEQTTSGFLSVRKGQDAVTTNALGIIDSVNKNLEKMGFLGIDKINTGGLENKFENGGLNFIANEISVGVDGYIEASGSLGITNSAFTFDVTSTVSVAGLAEGEFNLKRDEKGELAGKATISADIANVNASLTVEYEKGIVTIQGTGKMSSDKFSGEITLLVTDESKSKQMMHAALGEETMEADAQAPAAAAPAKKTKANQVLAGWGTVEATITPWLQGTANIGIDNKGQVTIVGTISVPDEIELMEQRGIKHDLFDVEIRAGYGIPLVGQVFLFASIGMFMNAGFGPLVLKDVAFTGTYSTDPSVLQNFSITGTLGINAFAILGLKAEAGVGVTLLGHDIKAGVAVTAAAGIRAYAEATPTFEYKEQKSPEGGKVGESRLKGHFEAAAQLFLQLTGSLFYELDSPWWSPAPDGRTDHPLGEVQYPIGDSMGIGADMDWLVGSEEPPELKFAPVEFDPDKFTADVMADPPPKKMGKSDQNPKGKFEDKGGGDQQKDPKTTGDGKGLPPNSKKEEDLKNLSDDQKYLRGLDELSKLEKADPKPTVAVVEAKMKKVKSKYGLEKVSVKGEKDGEVTVYVKHKKQDNTKNLLLIKTMSEAERKKLLDAAMADLKKREEKIVDKEGKTEEAKAKDMLTTWAKAHPIIESAKVIDGKTTWDYLLDVGDKDQTEKGKLKSGVEGENKVDKNNMDENAKKALDMVLGMEAPFENKSKEKHKLDFDMKGDKIVLYRKSIPQDIQAQIDAIDAAIKAGVSATDKVIAEDTLRDITKHWGDIKTILDNDLMPLFQRTKKVDDEIKTVSDNSFSQTKGKEIKRLLKSIAESLDNIPEIIDGKFADSGNQVRPPSDDVEFEETPLKFKNDKGKVVTSKDGEYMNAEKLSRIGPSNTSGSQPSGGGYSDLYDHLIKKGRKIVAAHLLNHQTFGRGNTTDNLTPLPSLKNNPIMENQFEKPIKDAILKDNKVIKYSITVTYNDTDVTGIDDGWNGPGSIPADKLIADKITAEAHEWKPKDGATDEEKKYAVNWNKKGDSLISDKTMEITADDIEKKGTPDKLEKLDVIIGLIDRHLASKPDTKWGKFIKTLQDNNTVPKGYANTDEGKAVKQEFFKKQDALGRNKTISGPSTYGEVLSNAKANIQKLTRNIKGKANKDEVETLVKSKGVRYDFVTASVFVPFLSINYEEIGAAKSSASTYSEAYSLGVRFKARSVTNYLVASQKITLEAQDLADLKEETKTTARDKILNRIMSKNLTDVEGEETQLIGDLKGDFEAMLVMTWSHLSNENDKDASTTSIEPLRTDLSKWGKEFNKKQLNVNESNLKEIEDNILAFLSTNQINESIKQELELELKQAKKRVELKRGELDAIYQKLIAQFRLDQENIDANALDPVNGHPQLNKIKSSDLNEYAIWRLGVTLEEADLSISQAKSANEMYELMQGQVKTKLDSLTASGS